MNDPQPISIYQPRIGDDGLVWVRPAPQLLGDHYATELQLTPKQPGDPPRICLFGESAAAGYLLMPHMSPAKALQGHLRHVLGDRAPQVIDLARTNERLHSLVATVVQALQLEPDLLIIFAGNNWNLLETPELSPYFPSPAGRQALATALQSGGLDAVIELGVRRRLGRAWNALTEIGAMAQACRLPVILVVPAVNLADWETVQPAPWLPVDELGGWYKSLAAARRHLARRRWQSAIDAAHAMLALDGGVSPTPYRILAHAYRGDGRQDAARVAAEAEVTSCHYTTLCALGAPQASVAEQEILRAAARVYGFTLVDLPAVFATQCQAAWPDRRVFLDYCHFSLEGVHVLSGALVAAVAQAWPALGLPDTTTLAGLLRYAVVPDAAHATALFGAAIHTAHRMADFVLKRDLVRHWCSVALDLSPDIVATMLDFAAARAAPVPALFTAAQGRMLASPYLLQFQHGWNYDGMDAVVIEVIIDLLTSRAPDLANAAVRQLVEHAPRRVDLLARDYHADPLMRFWPDLLPSPDRNEALTLRVPWPRARFVWPAVGDQDLRLDLTARLPFCRTGAVGLTVNGLPLAGLKLTDAWSHWSLRIPTRWLRRGLNEITLDFPVPVASPDIWATIAGELAAGREADYFPVFGELARLRIVLPI